MSVKKGTDPRSLGLPPAMLFPPVTAPEALYGESQQTDGQELGERIVEKAREYIGTPFFHAGREKGFGIDCVGLLLCVARDLGLTDYENRNYQPDHIDPEQLRGAVEQFCDLVPNNDLKDGDILLLRVANHPQHVAIYCSKGQGGLPTIIHAHAAIGRTVEDNYGRHVKMNLEAVYRWRA